MLLDLELVKVQGVVKTQLACIRLRMGQGLDTLDPSRVDFYTVVLVLGSKVTWKVVGPCPKSAI